MSLNQFLRDNFPGHNFLRQKIFAVFLTAIMVLAVGAELRTGIQSGAIVGSDSPVAAGIKSASGDREQTFRHQYLAMNKPGLVASRFYAPLHAPNSWKR